MKRVLSTVLATLFLVVTGCGGSGDTSDGGGAEEPVNPQNIAGTYSGTWEGSGTDENGVFTCSGEFVVTITQGGIVITANFNLVTGMGPCNDFFDAPGNGTYDASTGEVRLELVAGANTVDIVGTATLQGSGITLSGQWSTINTVSNAVVASGTWVAQSI